MNKGFSLIEILIVVAILGILAAIVMPEFQSQSIEAKETAVKDNLRILRQQIDLYATRHNDVPPGYPLNNPTLNPLPETFMAQMVNSSGYLSDLPENPFNNKNIMLMVPNDGSFPAEAIGQYGWIYQPQSKSIKLDWTGSDKDGIRYFDY